MRATKVKDKVTLDIIIEIDEACHVHLKENVGKRDMGRKKYTQGFFSNYSDLKISTISCCIQQCMALDPILALVLI